MSDAELEICNFIGWNSLKVDTKPFWFDGLCVIPLSLRFPFQWAERLSMSVSVGVNWVPINEEVYEDKDLLTIGNTIIKYLCKNDPNNMNSISNCFQVNN